MNALVPNSAFPPQSSFLHNPTTTSHSRLVGVSGGVAQVYVRLGLSPVFRISTLSSGGFVGLSGCGACAPLQVIWFTVSPTLRSSDAKRKS